MKHCPEFLIWLLKPFIILGEIQSKISQNFVDTSVTVVISFVFPLRIINEFLKTISFFFAPITLFLIPVRGF